MSEFKSDLDRDTHIQNVVVPATIVFKSSFLGDNRLAQSFSVVNGSYENFFGLAGPEHVYIHALVANGTEAEENLELHRGQSYNYTMEVLVGDFHQDLKMDIRNLPCGVTASFPEDANLTNSSQTMIPLNIVVKKDASVGNYHASILAKDSFGKEYYLDLLRVAIT